MYPGTKYGGQNPLTIDCDWASEFAAATSAAKHAGDYKINLKLTYVFPFIQCQCFDKRRGVYFVEKISVSLKIRVLFWPEISALGVFFYFDNECMGPPKYPSALIGLLPVTVLWEVRPLLPALASTFNNNASQCVPSFLKMRERDSFNLLPTNLTFRLRRPTHGMETSRST